MERKPILKPWRRTDLSSLSTLDGLNCIFDIQGVQRKAEVLIRVFGGFFFSFRYGGYDLGNTLKLICCISSVYRFFSFDAVLFSSLSLLHITSAWDGLFFSLSLSI